MKFTYSKYFIVSNLALLYYFYKQYKKSKMMKKKYKVLITGGAGGLGWSLAQKFLKNNSEVLIVDHNQDSLDKIPNQDKLTKYKCDITTPDNVLKMYKEINPDSIDILINNAGIANKKLLSDLTPDDIKRTFNVNTLALFWMTKYMLPYFKKKNKGQIVTISSVGGLVGAEKMVDYCSSKFAARGFHVSLDKELKDTNIDLTCICPYFFKTKLFERVSGYQWPFSLLIHVYDLDEITELVYTDIMLRKNKVCIYPRLFRYLLRMRDFFPKWVQDNFIILGSKV